MILTANESAINISFNKFKDPTFRKRYLSQNFLSNDLNYINLISNNLNYIILLLINNKFTFLNIP